MHGDSPRPILRPGLGFELTRIEGNDTLARVPPHATSIIAEGSPAMFPAVQAGPSGPSFGFPGVAHAPSHMAEGFTMPEHSLHLLLILAGDDAPTSETPDLKTVATLVDAILERLGKPKIQVRYFVRSGTVEAKAFVVRDERGDTQARWRCRSTPPRLTLHDRLGTEHLRIGRGTDGSPSFQVGERKMLLDDK